MTFEQELLGIRERIHEMYSRLDACAYDFTDEERVSDLKFLSERLRGILSEEERKAALELGGVLTRQYFGRH